MVYVTSKFVVGKKFHRYIFHLNLTQLSKTNEQVKYPFLLQDKVNRLLELYAIVSPVNKDRQPKGYTFNNPVTNHAKGESLAIVL